MVSLGTLRREDLIPEFLDVIKDTPEYVQLINAFPAYTIKDKNFGLWDVMILENLKY